jgi:hypothetical protein
LCVGVAAAEADGADGGVVVSVVVVFARGNNGARVLAPSPREIEVGFRLVPIVLGLRAAEKHQALLDSGVCRARDLVGGDQLLAAPLLSTLASAGVVEPTDDADTAPLTATGRRVLEKGIGPFGIIEAYHQYMTKLDEILCKGRGAVWVERGANVAASQDANRHTFELANAALDRANRHTFELANAALDRRCAASGPDSEISAC